MMKVEIKIIPRSEMPYDTFDNYFWRGDVLVFEIAETGNWLTERMMLLHAMVEQLLTEIKGISPAEITAFDMAYKGDGEPGEEINCPYRNEHLIAKAVEMLLCSHMDIPWKTYEEDLCDDKVGRARNGGDDVPGGGDRS